MATTTRSDRTASTSIKHWPGWDYVPGIAFLLVGILALIEPPVASFATAFYLGLLLCVGGGFVLASGIVNLGHRGAWLALLLGLFSLGAGAVVIYNPVAGAISLTWLLGAWLIVGGLSELLMGFNISVGKSWLILVGLVNLAFGVLIIMMQPAMAFAFLGYMVGLSFIFRGLWSVVFTADLHRAEHALGG